jgi:hypothetical protein
VLVGVGVLRGCSRDVVRLVEEEWSLMGSGGVYILREYTLFDTMCMYVVEEICLWVL